jgi:hypothetical protein
MSRIFYRKKFSDYLGEQRAIDDIVQFYIPDGGVTPTPTPVPVTPTPTPSITPTNTPTVTTTPTLTKTPTPTPTRTPAPACDITYTELPSPTPSPTPTITPTITSSPTPTPTASPGPSFDPDAAAYLSAVVAAGGAVSSPMSGATNTMFLALKSNGIYGKLSAFYPILGGIQSSHAIEGKNPTGSQNLTFNGSWVHNDKGMRPSACSTSNYADTQYLPTSLNPNSNHMFAYFNGTGTQFGTACGSSTYDGAGPGPYFILGHPAFEFFSSDGIVSAAGNITAYGAVIGTRIGSNDTRIFRSIDGGAWGQGSSTNTTAPSTYPSNSITIGKINPSGFPASDRYAFFSFGDGLDTTEATNYYNIVLAYQTALNRNTY